MQLQDTASANLGSGRSASWHAASRACAPRRSFLALGLGMILGLGAAGAATNAAAGSPLPQAVEAWVSELRADCVEAGGRFTRGENFFKTADFNGDGQTDYVAVASGHQCSLGVTYYLAGQVPDWTFFVSDGNDFITEFFPSLEMNLATLDGRDVAILSTAGPGAYERPFSTYAVGWADGKLDVLERYDEQGRPVDAQGRPSPATGSAAASPQEGGGSDEARIQSLIARIYGVYQSPPGQGGASGPVLTPGLIALEEAAMDDLTGLGGDAFCECQDYDERAASHRVDAVVFDTPDAARARVAFRIFADEPLKPLTIHLRKLDDRWLVDDIESPRFGLYSDVLREDAAAMGRN